MTLGATYYRRCRNVHNKHLPDVHVVALALYVCGALNGDAHATTPGAKT